MKKKLRIMIIEDSENDSLLIIRKIKTAGYEIEYERIETENEMKKALREKEWDLILSDFKLPKFSGIDALKILNETGIDIPFIIISGTIGEDVAVGCMKAGANDYIMKNNMKRLMPAVERELRDAKIRVKHREAEEALAISEESYRTLIENQGEGVGIVDLKEEFTFVNPAGEKIFGVSPGGLTNRSLREFVKAEQFKIIQSQTLKRSRGEKSTYELEIVRPDHEKRTLLVTGTPKYNKSGDFLGTFGVFVDITDRKRMELALREREKHDQSLLRLSKKLESAQNNKDVLKAAHTEVKQIIGYNSIWVNLFDKDKQYAKSLMAGGKVENTVENGTAVFVVKGDSLMEEIVSAKSIVIVEDAGTDPRTNKKVVEQFGNKTIVNIPILLYDEILGSVGMGTFGDEGIYLPSQSEQEYLMSMASHMAVTLHRLHVLEQRKKTEEALRQSEERYRIITENTVDTISVFDLDFKPIYVSPSVFKLRGFTVEEALQQTLDQILTEKSFNIAYEVLSKQIALEKSGNLDLNRSEILELEEYCKDGSIIWVELTASFLRDNNLELIGIITVTRDITERKRSENIISESERRFKELANLLPQTIFESNIDGIITFANDAGLKAFGYAVEELSKGLYMLDMVSEKDKESASENIKLVLEGLPPVKNEYNMVRKDGSNFPALTFTSAIIRDGKPAGLRGTIVDITNQKQTENELRKLSEAVEQSPASILITDTNGNIEYVNKTFCDNTGYSFEEVKNKNPKIFSSGHTSRKEYKRLWNSILSGNTWFGEFLNKKKNGDLYWENAIITPIKDLEGTIINFLAVKTDITERKKVEKELELHRNHLQELVNIKTDELNEVNKKLKEEILKQKEAEKKVQQALKKEKELNQLKTRFISIASHEFRTPLSIILSSADLLNRYGNKWEPNISGQQIERIKKNVNRMTDIMDDVLIISRADSGKITFKPENVDLETICTTILNDMSLLLTKKHNLIFKYLLDDKIFLLDENLLELILSNLLSNAIKYSINGGDIEFTVFADGNNIVFKIADKGIGIPEKDQFHLFDSFHRASNVGEVLGTGLGLSIVHRSVKIHGGSVEFSSKEGTGTTFIVKIPIIE